MPKEQFPSPRNYLSGPGISPAGEKRINAELSKLSLALDEIKALADRIAEEENRARPDLPKLNSLRRELLALIEARQDLPDDVRKLIENKGEAEFIRAKRELAAAEAVFFKQNSAYEIPVPPVPKEITQEQFEFWQKNKLKLHYSPGIEIKEDSDFPGYKKKLGKNIFKWIKEKELSPDAATLPKGWILIDERPKPEYDSGRQMYEDDILAPVLADLREKGLIEDYEEKGSRFNVSWNEFNHPEVKKAIAKALKVKPEQLELMKYALFNYIGNKSHPEWGETSTWEWFQDEYEGGDRLGGGDSDDGGRSRAYYFSSGYRSAYLGFRPSARFSS